MLRKTSAFSVRSFGFLRFGGGVFRDGITPTALSYTPDSSSGFSLAVARGCGGIGRGRLGLAWFELGVSAKNPVRVASGDLDQRFRARLGYSKNSGRVMRRSKPAVDSDRSRHR
jgi:hypothetical protein